MITVSLAVSAAVADTLSTADMLTLPAFQILLVPVLAGAAVFMAAAWSISEARKGTYSAEAVKAIRTASLQKAILIGLLAVLATCGLITGWMSHRNTAANAGTVRTWIESHGLSIDSEEAGDMSKVIANELRGGDGFKASGPGGVVMLSVQKTGDGSYQLLRTSTPVEVPDAGAGQRPHTTAN